MLQYIDPNSHFRALIDAVSHQIAHTSLSDWEIADNCHTSTEFVRRQRKFLLLGPYTCSMKGEDEMAKPRIHEISYDDLYREYVENIRTIKECGEFFGCSQTVIHNRMEEYGIPKRRRGNRVQENGENTNGTPPDVPDGVEIRTLHPKTKQPTDEEKRIIYAAHGSEETASAPETLTEHPEVAKHPSTRHLERLVLLSAVKGTSIQGLLEEALELLFEKYR